MPEIGTSGSMSGDGKRGVAEWPKLPRPSSTLPEPTIQDVALRSDLKGKPDLALILLEGRADPKATSRLSCSLANRVDHSRLVRAASGKECYSAPDATNSLLA
jgi:hypothetical protein